MNNSAKPSSCLILGAGLAGLVAARELQAHGVRVTVLDKGRGVGGRMATRRLGEALCDHGAQFFTVREPRFAALLNEWQQAGLASEWARGFAIASGLRTETASDLVAREDGHPRYRGLGGMNALAKWLAQGLDVRVSEQVTHIRWTETGWELTAASGLIVSAEALLLTPPVPQSLALLEAGGNTLPPASQSALERISYDPCFAVLAVLSQPSRIPAPGAIRFEAEPAKPETESWPLAWLADNQQKGISPAPAVTLHATPDFTRAHWETPPEIVAQKLLAAAQPWLGEMPLSYQVHRWRYSQPVVTHPERCLCVPTPGPLVFAGDAFGGPRVEGAALSGWAAAEALLAAFK